MAGIRWFALPVLALPLYSVAVSLEACSGAVNQGTPDTGTDAAVGCAPNEETKRVASGDICCERTLGVGPRECRDPNGAQPGDACSSLGATTSGTKYSVAFDVCVEETCAGDKICSEFPLSVEKASGVLQCVSRGGQNIWEWASAPALHLVRRACLVAEYRTCFGPKAGASTPTGASYNYAPASFDPREEACGYGPGPRPYYGGYGGYGSTSIAVRSLFLVGSTCRSGEGPATDCPVDDL